MRVAPETPNGPFNLGDKIRVAQCGYPTSGNCLSTRASQFLPCSHQDTVLLPAFGATQSQDHTAKHCWGQADPLSLIQPRHYWLCTFQMSLAQPAALGAVITHCLARVG